MGSDAPRWVAVLSAWANVLAGITLVIADFILFVALQLKDETANTAIVTNGKGPVGHGIYTVYFWTMFTEGVLWCLAGLLLCYRNICSGNAAGAVSQCIIAGGGFFFACSAFGNPGNIISLRYLIPIGIMDAEGNVGKTWVSFADACPFYGIALFMAATTMGMYSVRGLPKNKIVSPFFGVLCFFIGAWTIGVVTLYVPMLAGGETSYEDVNGLPFDMPTYAWSQVKIFAVIGACFLLAGGIIFGIMDNFLGLPTKDNKLLAANGAEA